MKFFVHSCCQICLIVFLICLCYGDGSPKAPKRARLLNGMGLIPFPRIGRGGDATWDIETEYPKWRRTWMSEDERIKRTGTKNMNTGLWFGPRLGRFQKRGGGYSDQPWSYVLLGEAPSYRQTPKYTPRLGRESEESIDDSYDENLITTEHAA